MAEQGKGVGRVVLWVVLGVVGLIVLGNIAWWLVSKLVGVLVLTLVVGAIAGVTFLVIRAARRTISGGRDRRQLPY